MGWVRIGVLALVKGPGGARKPQGRGCWDRLYPPMARAGGSRKGGRRGAEAPLPHRRHTLAGKTSGCAVARAAAGVVAAMPAAAPGAAVAAGLGWAGKKELFPRCCCLSPSLSLVLFPVAGIAWLPWLLLLILVRKLLPPSTSLFLL